MDLFRRIARSPILPATLAAALLCGASGCAEWISNLSNPEAWEKLSPSNIWYNMQPHRLNRLNEGEGMPSDVYYSVPDPLTVDGLPSDVVRAEASFSNEGWSGDESFCDARPESTGALTAPSPRRR